MSSSIQWLLPFGDFGEIEGPEGPRFVLLINIFGIMLLVPMVMRIQKRMEGGNCRFWSGHRRVSVGGRLDRNLQFFSVVVGGVTGVTLFWCCQVRT